LPMLITKCGLMRRAHLALLLPLLLVFAQQGGLLHEFSHLHYTGRALGAQLQRDQEHLHNSQCISCQSFSQVANPASGTIAVLAASRTAAPSHVYACRTLVGEDSPTPRSRGPPQVHA